MGDAKPFGLGDCLALSKLEISSQKRLFELVADEMATKQTIFSALQVYRNLLEREKLGSTALGGGVAIPHCRVSGLQHTLGCIVTLKDGIEFSASDDQNVDIVFILLVPERATDQHLQLLAALARMFSDAAKKKLLRGTADSPELKRIVLEGIKFSCPS